MHSFITLVTEAFNLLCGSYYARGQTENKNLNTWALEVNQKMHLKITIVTNEEDFIITTKKKPTCNEDRDLSR
jgi:hypothetical protein